MNQRQTFVELHVCPIVRTTYRNYKDNAEHACFTYTHLHTHTHTHMHTHLHTHTYTHTRTHTQTHTHTDAHTQ